MKKTLLAAAAILAVGSLASQAQVYSQNIVGYYNVTLPGSTFVMVSGQLINSDGSNSVNHVITTGLASGIAQLLTWNGSSFDYWTYYNDSDAGGPGLGGFYDASTGTIYSTNTVAPGQGVFVNNGTAGTTVTVVGTVPQGAFSTTLPNGLSIYSLNVPVATNVDSAAIGLPLTSSVDQLLIWNGNGYDYYTYYNDSDAGGAGLGGFYDASTGTTNISKIPADFPPVGSSFFLNHAGGAATWTNNFTF